MKLVLSARFDRSLLGAPLTVRRAFWKQADYLLDNLRHPSLHAKKYDESRRIWQARVTRSWRFCFRIVGDEYQLIDITAHPK